MKPLEQLDFDNSFSRLSPELYSRISPTPFNNAYLVSFNSNAANCIGLDPKEAGRQDFVNYFCGKAQLPNSDPLAMCYSGHQFGHYVPRLGDGRAILLGQVRNGSGESWDLHLKGAGKTLYSRDGDGRAVLRSTVREYLCGEAMHGLGIPTSRALCIIGSDDEVYREQIETGAMLLRLAPSHIRFGHFEYLYYTNQFELLQKLADHVITEHFPELVELESRYQNFLEQVVTRTAELIAQWQAVGFAHGVMNTDNMSILGLTLDYGPFGFLDSYQPGFICNHSDHHGRYAFDQQPNIGLFNLSCLAQALLPLLSEEPDKAVELAKNALELYQPALVIKYSDLMRKKLGLQSEHEHDQELCNQLLSLMENNDIDYTIFFRQLAQFNPDNLETSDSYLDRLRQQPPINLWFQQYSDRLKMENNDNNERGRRMNEINPKYILRNYMAENAIRLAQEEKNHSEINVLLNVLSNPFSEQPEYERYAAEPPEWAEKISVSCSS